MVAFVDTISDADVPLLVQRAQAGSIEAFGLLVEYYEGGVYRYLVRALRNHEDACDYVQQVFLKAWLNLASLQNMMCFKVWLYTIARNLMRDRWRKKEPACVYWEELVGGDTVDASTRDPEEYAADIELMLLALTELTPKLRYCLVLRVAYGYLPCEIACMVGINESSVGTYISMARKQLVVICERLLSEEQPDV